MLEVSWGSQVNLEDLDAKEGGAKHGRTKATGCSSIRNGQFSGVKNEEQGSWKDPIIAGF